MRTILRTLLLAGAFGLLTLLGQATAHASGCGDVYAGGSFTGDDGQVLGDDCEKKTEQPPTQTPPPVVTTPPTPVTPKETPAPQPSKTTKPKPTPRPTPPAPQPVKTKPKPTPIKSSKPKAPRPPRPSRTYTPPTQSSTPKVYSTPSKPLKKKLNETPPAKIISSAKTKCLVEIKLENPGGKTGVAKVGKHRKVAVPAHSHKVVTIPVKKAGPWKVKVVFNGKTTTYRGVCDCGPSAKNAESGKVVTAFGGVDTDQPNAAAAPSDSGVSTTGLLLGVGLALLAGFALRGGYTRRKNGTATAESESTTTE